MVSATTVSQMQEWMNRLDSAWIAEPGFGRDDWSPESPEVAEAVAKLISPANRPALIAWYANYSRTEMNPTARWFCEFLERKTGTSLGRQP